MAKVKVKSAKVQVSPDMRLDLIAEAAGQPDPEKRAYRDGFLEVEGVTQGALREAISSQYVADKVAAHEADKKRKVALANKWPDAFALLDDVLQRGAEAVKLERDEIKADNPKGEAVISQEDQKNERLG